MTWDLRPATVHIYWNKESFYIWRTFNTHGTGLEHQHSRRFIGLEYRYGCRDVMWKLCTVNFTLSTPRGIIFIIKINYHDPRCHRRRHHHHRHHHNHNNGGWQLSSPAANGWIAEEPESDVSMWRCSMLLLQSMFDIISPTQANNGRYSPTLFEQYRRFLLRLLPTNV